MTRKFDVSIWHPEQKLTGPNKLVQRFLIEFLTRRGSDFFRPQRGTDFLKKWDDEINTEAMLFSSFAAAEMQARKNLQIEETKDDPDDERYARTTFAKLAVENDVIYMHLQVENRSGLATPVIVPLAS